MKTKTSLTTDSINLSPLRCALLLISLVFACFGLSPAARAICQEGCDLAHNNTFLGDDALTSNTTGILNTATGADALLLNTTGNFNTATGAFALLNNTTGSDNTASGFQALKFNTTGTNNTATGLQALFSNTTGNNNTATGYFALSESSTGSNNTASGVQALYFNFAGNNDTANGVNALFSNTTGSDNTADGAGALLINGTGSFNIALGRNAGNRLANGDYNIDIGNRGARGEARTIRIGTEEIHKHTFIAGISGVTVAGGVGVIIDTDGHLGTVVSSTGYKEAIKPMDKASEAILALKPVTFRYKKELDLEGIPQFGLVAEQVEKVNPDLVARDEQGKPYTVRYEAVNAMLLNEFLKQHRTVEELKKDFQATIAQQQNEIKALAATVKEQAAQIQKVSAQVELSKPAPQTVLNNQ